FLNPLLFQVLVKEAPNALYRGRSEGITLSMMRRVLGARQFVRGGTLTNIVIPSLLESYAARSKRPRPGGIERFRPMPKSTYLSLLKGLEQQIGRLSIVDQSKSRWADYTPLT
uniref:hypothetical protein n=1 Tax=Enterobacter hormaechei TaxID=158836 RepID=UPI001954BB89